MAIPAEKNKEIDDFISDNFTIDRKGSIKNNKCVRCNADAYNFKDAISRKEYTISGLCQSCQDFIFE